MEEMTRLLDDAKLSLLCMYRKVGGQKKIENFANFIVWGIDGQSRDK